VGDGKREAAAIEGTTTILKLVACTIVRQGALVTAAAIDH